MMDQYSPVPDTWSTLVTGLQALDVLWLQWPKYPTSGEDNFDLLTTINTLCPQEQRSLFRIVEALTCPKNWNKDDLEVEMKTQVVDIPSVLWAIWLGPKGLVIGWARGMKTDEILRVAKQDYLEMYQDDDEKLALVEDLAKDLLAWTLEVSKRTAA